MDIFIIVGIISKVLKDLLFFNQNASEGGQGLSCEFYEHSRIFTFDVSFSSPLY